MRDDVPLESSRQLEAQEHVALGWAAVIAASVVLWLVMPIGIGILLGTFLAFMAQPMFHRLESPLGQRSAALLTVTLATLALAATLGGLAWLFVAKGTVLAGKLLTGFKPGGFADDAIASVARLTDRLGVSRGELESHARELAARTVSHVTDVAESIASTTGGALLAVLFAMMSMHYMLRNWERVSRRAQESLPLRPEYTAALLDEFRKVGRTTMLGAVGTAIAQGVLAMLGFAIAGVPEPVFFGAATALASFVPAVGVLLVIVPISIGLFLAGSPGHAVIEIVWSAVLVIGFCDYVLRPRMVRGESKVPSLVTFAALFGGVEVFGFKGVLIGPVLMSLAIAVLRLYATETRERRQLVQPPEINSSPDPSS